MRYFLAPLVIQIVLCGHACAQTDGLICSFSGNPNSSNRNLEPKSRGNPIVKYLESASRDILARYQLRVSYRLGLDNVPEDTAKTFTKGGQRFILFDRNIFRNLLEEEPTTWAARMILAHEIGHLLQGHTVRTVRSPELELEADEFAGGALFLLGAQLHEAQAAIHKYAARDPLRVDRLKAVRKGWVDARTRDDLISRRNEYATGIRNAWEWIVRGNHFRGDYILRQLLPRPGEPDVRSFAWYHYWKTLHAEDKILRPEPHEYDNLDGANQVGFIPGKNLIVTAYASPPFSTGAIEFRSLADGSLKKRLTIPTNVLAISPDGSQVAIRAVRGESIDNLEFGVALIDTSDFSVRPMTGGQRAYIKSLAFSPDGRTLAAGTVNGTVMLWDIKTGEHVIQKGHEGAVNALTYSPDSQYLLTGGSDEKLLVWNTRPLKIEREWKLTDEDVVALDFTTTNKLAIAHTSSVDIYEYLPAQEGMLYHQYTISFSNPEKDSRVLAIDLHPTEPLLAVGDNEGWVSVHVFEYGETIARFGGHIGNVLDIEFSEDGELLLTGDSGFVPGLSGRQDSDSGSTTRLFRWRDTTPIKPEFFADRGAGEVAAHDKLFAFSPEPGGNHIHLLKSPSAAPKSFILNTGVVSSIAFTPNGERIAIGDGPSVDLPLFDRYVIFISSMTGMEVSRVKTEHEQYISDIVFSSDGGTMVTTSHDRLIVWDVVSIDQGNIVKRCDVIEGSSGFDFQALANRVALSHDNSIVAGVASPGSTMKLWNLSTCSAAGTYGRNGSWGAYSLTFSPDGEFIAEGNQDWSVVTWSRLKQNQPVVSIGHAGVPQALAFAPGKRILASGGWRTDSIRLWESGTGLPIGELSNGYVSLEGLVFNSDSTSLAGIGGEPQPMRVTWFATPEEDVYSYFKLRAEWYSKSLVAQNDFIRAAWGRYQHLVSVGAVLDARQVLGEAYANLFARKPNLSSEEQQWLEEFEAVFEDKTAQSEPTPTLPLNRSVGSVRAFLK